MKILNILEFNDGYDTLGNQLGGHEADRLGVCPNPTAFFDPEMVDVHDFVGDKDYCGRTELAVTQEEYPYQLAWYSCPFCRGSIEVQSMSNIDPYEYVRYHEWLAIEWKNPRGILVRRTAPKTRPVHQNGGATA
jgi:hypothetical protein